MTKKLFSVEDFREGLVLLVDKPEDWTSFDVVAKLRGVIKSKLRVKKYKVGHAGTLDPLATGLLIVCTGKRTKEIQEYQDRKKEYTGIITLGGTTPTYDLEMPVDRKFPTDHISEEDLRNACRTLTGEIDQNVPVYSAVKVDGRRMYQLARKGEPVRIKSRQVVIHDFEIETTGFPEIGFRISTSKGTYIRSVAHDFGKLVHSGAYLSRLRRTKIGEFCVDDAWNLDELVEVIRQTETEE